jgi:hypothetical protein
VGQLRELGFGGSGIERRLRRDALLPVHRGVYSVGHRRLTAEGRWMAAVLAAGSEAILSHRSAGQLWGLLPRAPSRPEITRPRSFRQRDGIVAHRSAISPDEIEVVDGIPVTSVSRTLLDLAGVLSRSQLERALNEAEVRQMTSRLSGPDLLAASSRPAGGGGAAGGPGARWGRHHTPRARAALCGPHRHPPTATAAAQRPGRRARPLLRGRLPVGRRPAHL